MVYAGQKLFGLTLAVTLLLVVAADGRPPYFETNEIERIQPGLTYNPFYPYPNINRYPEGQYEKLRLYFEGQQDNKIDPSTGGNAAETLLREPESKRQQVRYRQCYFNPISCFRK